MMDRSQYDVRPPHSPAEPSGRIPIDALLNPTRSLDSPKQQSYTPRSVSEIGDSDYYTRHQYQTTGSSLKNGINSNESTARHIAYTPTQFQPVQYLSPHPSPLEMRVDPAFPSHTDPSSHHHHHHYQQYNTARNHDSRQSGSTNSSPGPYRRERFPSVSSGSSSNNVSERRRPPRPKYDEEEMYFIWYHRVDLGQEWKQVRESFNAQFPNRQRNGFQGIQCKYYRFIKEKNCPTLREQRRRRSAATGGNDGGSSAKSSNLGDDQPAYGVVRWTGARFSWMKEP